MLIFVLMSTPVGAQDRQKAREIWRRGMQHYNLGEFREALDSFKAAYREVEDPTFLYNLGQCARQLAQRRDALQFFRAYLREVPNANNGDQVRALVARLEAEIAAAPAPETPPPEAEPPKSTPATMTTLAASSPKSPSPALTQEAPRRQIERPVYERWYVWTAVAVVVAAGGGVALGLTLGPKSPSATTTEGTFMPFGGR